MIDYKYLDEITQELFRPQRVFNFGRRKITKQRVAANIYRNGKEYPDILKQANYSCKLCGDREYIIVHHLDKNVKNNDRKNLLVVCKRCHAKLHGQTLRFTKPNMILIKELRSQDYTYREIGEYLGISRQRVNQIINQAEKIGMNIKRGHIDNNSLFERKWRESKRKIMLLGSKIALNDKKCA